MNLWKNLLILATVICLVSPVAVSAFDEVPSFSNPAQAQHAENIAKASFSDPDYWEDVEERAKTAYAEDMADALVEQKAQDYAEGVFVKKAEEYAEDFVVQKSVDHADSAVDAENRATEYANSKADSGTIVWDEEYQYALEQLRSSEEWKEANSYAYQRSTGEGYKNLKLTTYENWMKDPENAYVKEEAYDYAKERAYGDFGPGHPNAYQTSLQRFYGEVPPPEIYEEYLTKTVSEITGERIEEIRILRERHMGWGQIKKMYPVPKEVLGLGHSYEASIKIPKQEMARPAPEPLSLADEIAEVTNRSKNNGWNNNQVSTKQKGNSKKWIGLNETSLKAEAAVSDVGAGNGKSSNGKGGSSAGAGKSNNSNKSQTSLSSVSSPSGKDKSNNGNNGKSSNSAKSDKNDRGNSGNNGKNDKNDRGNSDNNGNGKGKK